jgi:NADH-quinone oxidoreductase subunit L
MEYWVLALIILPLLSFGLLSFVGEKLPRRGALLSIFLMAISFFLSLGVLYKVLIEGDLSFFYNWLPVGKIFLKAGFLIDTLSAIMLVLVTLISLLIQIYSLGYMAGEERFSWFYAVLSLFTASMLGVVAASSYLFMYFCWELMGLCSYLLIGFWKERETALAAAKKAFLVTRLGDLAFLLGIIYLYFTVGTTEILRVSTSTLTPAKAGLISLLLFGGAVGKSAQFPLHIWLPDAMEGPTPVSAFLHSATMVAAGVYLVARSYSLFSLSPTVFQVITFIGLLTSFLAATMACVAREIKKILAYSTISHLGYMMLGLGTGGLGAGVFHLISHAFFKALLFLGAGCMIHATHTHDIFEMGGLFKRMKITSIAFLIASLSLAGVPPFSGFFSKDEILTSAFASGWWGIFIIALITTFLSAFYIFRLFFIAFLRESNKEIKEAPPIMTFPMIILAFLSIIGGLWKVSFAPFLEEEGEILIAVLLLSLGLSLLGILVAGGIYLYGWTTEENIRSRLTWIYKLIENKYYLDHFYGFVTEKAAFGFSCVCRWFDHQAINKGIDGFAILIRVGGKTIRPVQTGRLRSYMWIIFFTLCIILSIYWWFTLSGVKGG